MKALDTDCILDFLFFYCYDMLESCAPNYLH